MKKYITYQILLLLTAILVAAGCSSTDSSLPVYLTLSEEHLLEFAGDVSETKKVEVTTNSDSWDCIKNIDWIEITRSSNAFEVKVQVNTTTERREGEIMVLAGSALKRIKVIQLGSSSVDMQVSPTREIDPFGGEVFFDVETSIPDWEIQTEATWIKASIQRKISRIEVAVEENKSRDPRTAKIYITTKSGVLIKELTISQAGMMYHVLPYMGFLEEELQVRNFEIARFSMITTIPDGIINKVFWSYQTVSPAFNKITYSFRGDLYRSAVVFCTDPNLFSNREELEQQKTFLEENGFKEIETNLFYSEQLQTEARIDLKVDLNRIVYTFSPIQPAPQPTISEFPFLFNNFSYSPEDVAKWEKENGGIFNEAYSFISPTKTNYYFYDTPGHEYIAFRQYTFTAKGRLTGCYIALPESMIEHAFFWYKDNVFLTNEFKALMKREGFSEPVQVDVYNYRFYHLDKALQVFVRIVEYDEPVLEFEIHRL